MTDKLKNRIQEKLVTQKPTINVNKAPVAIKNISTMPNRPNLWRVDEILANTGYYKTVRNFTKKQL